MRSFRDIKKGKIFNSKCLVNSALFVILNLFCLSAYAISVPATSTGSYTVSFQGYTNTSTTSSSTSTLIQTGTSNSSYFITTNTNSKTFTDMPSGTYHYKLENCTTYDWIGTLCDSDFGPLTTVSVVVTNTPPVPPVPAVPGVVGSTTTDTVQVFFYLSQVATNSQLQESKNNGPWTSLGAYGPGANIQLPRTTGSYRYRRSECNTQGCSGYSNISTPIQVWNVPGLPGPNPVQLNSTTGTYTFSWPPHYNAAIDQPTYIISRRLEAEQSYSVIPGGGLSVSESGIPEGVHHYNIKACNPIGDCSNSAGKVMTVSFVPSVPSITAPSIDTDGLYDVVMSSIGTVDRYELKEQTNGGGFSDGGNNDAASISYAKTTDTTYKYKARACNTNCSAWSAVKTVQVLRTPSVPPNFSSPGTSSSGHFTVDWSPASGSVDYYELLERISGGSWSDPLADSDGDLTAEYQSGKSNGTYGYIVRACNVESCSAWSSEVSTTVSPSVAAISGPSSNTSGTFSLNWSADHNLLVQDGYGTYYGTSKTFTDLPSGVYHFTLDYCGIVEIPLGEVEGSVLETICTPSAAETKTVVVTRDEEPTIQNFTSVAGTTSYSSRVSQRGGARISIPVLTPQGVNDFQPSLSLQYDSARATDIADTQTLEDSLGYGWRLSGLSRLHRCRVGLAGSNKIQLNTSDRLCLDGNPLIAVSGNYWASNAEYRTEIQSFIKITPFNGGFKIEYPDGRVGLFGTTNDSKNYLPGMGIYDWHLKEMSHPMAVGASIFIDYKSFNGYGAVVPEQISYAGKAIVFKYGPRSDLAIIPIGANNFPGRGLKRHTVLHTITTYSNNNPVREFHLDSNIDSGGRVRLETVEECAFNEAGSYASCMQPIDFNWINVAGSASQYPIVVSAFTDGFDATTEFNYTDVTTTNNPSTYPEGPFGDLPALPGIARQPLAVVTEFRKSDGLSNSTQKRWTFNYKNYPYKSTSNRGYIGFYEKRLKDEQTLALNYTQLRMDFPFFGAVGRTVDTTNTWGTGTEYSRSEISYNLKTLINGAIFPHSSTTTYWATNSTGITSARQTQNSVCFRQPVGNTCSSNGAEGELITQTSSVNYLGSSIGSPNGAGTTWGDVPGRSISDLQQTITSNAILSNTVTPWLIGAATEITTTHSVPDKPIRTVTNTATYKPGTLTAKVSTVFPGDSELEATRSLAFSGNLLVSETLSGVDAPSKTISFDNYVDDRYPTTISNQLNHQSQLDYDHRFGAPKTITDANNNMVETHYDEFGRIVSSLANDGTMQAATYERCDQVTCPPEVINIAVMKITNTTTHSGLQVAPTNTVYKDRLGRTVLQETQAFNASNGWQRQLNRYDNRGRITGKSRPYFSADGAPDCDTGDCIRYEYSVQAAAPSPLKEDRVLITSAHIVSTRTESTAGRKTTTKIDTGISGGTSNSVFNLLGQLILKRERIGDALEPSIVTEYDYDAHGNLIEVKINDRIVATMDYELNGNRNYIFDVNTGVTTTDANALGELLTVTDAKNQVTKFQYDQLGRLKTRWDDFGGAKTVTNEYSYDPQNAIGALASRSNGQFTESYQFNSELKLQSITSDINVPGLLNEQYLKSLNYDAQGRLSSVSYPSGFTTTQSYSNLGYLTKLFEGAKQLQSIEEVNAFNQTTLIKHGDQGLQTRKVYGARGQLQQLQTGNINTPKAIQDIEYKWNLDRSLHQRIDKRNSAATGDDVTDTFTYDSLFRLSEQTTSGTASRTLSFSYDDFGNITQKQITSGMGAGDSNATNYDYSDSASPHRLLSVNLDGVHNDLIYDDNGNITRYDSLSGEDTFIDYDGQNQVTQITLGNSTSETNPTARDEFWYGPDGGRFLHRETWQENGTQEKITTYLGNFEEVRRNNGDLDVMQTTDLGSVRHFRRVSFLSQVNTWLEFVHRDNQGSIDAITDEAGNLLSKVSFDAFGGMRETDWTQSLHPLTASFMLSILDERPVRGYTDHEHLPRTGFIHMNGRVYDPRTGRFLSADPFIQAPGMSQSYNRYTYVMNNPVMYTDPSGFTTRCGEIEGDNGMALPCEYTIVVVDIEHKLAPLPSAHTPDKLKFAMLDDMLADMFSHLKPKPPCPHCARNIDYLMSSEGNHLGISGISGIEIEGLEGNATGTVGKAGSGWNINWNRVKNNVVNGLTVVGGGAQVFVGVGLCSTGLGCALGGPLIVFGTSNVIEGGSGLLHPEGEGFSITKAAIDRVPGVSGNTATKINAVINLTLDLASLNVAHAPASAAALAKASHSGATLRVISDGDTAFVAVAPKFDSTQTGLVINAILEATTTYGATQ